MKLINLTQFQQSELTVSHPENSVANYAAIVPEYEYRAWAEVFADLTMRFVDFFGLTDHHVYMNKLPLFHWTAKLTTPVSGSGKLKDRGVLLPKAYKIGALAEGTYKNFGYQPLLLRFLNSFWATFDDMSPSDFMKWEYTLDAFHNKNYLGVMSWNQEDWSENVGDRYMPLYCGNCVRDVSKIEVVKLSDTNKVMACLDGEELYDHVIPTNHYLDDDAYRAKMQELDSHGLLATPLNFQPARIETYLDFTHESWSAVGVYPGTAKFRKQAETSGDHLLIKRDTHKIYSWSAAQSDPIVRLALEMEDEWLWQETCPSPFPNLNMYWSPALNYPWFRDRKTKEWVPALIMRDKNG